MAGGRKSSGGPDVRVAQAPFNPVGPHTANSSLAAAVTLTPPNISPAVIRIQVQAIDQNIRYTLDGAMPTTTFGFRITAGNDPIILTIGPSTTLRFVEEAGGATLEYVWGQ